MDNTDKKMINLDIFWEEMIQKSQWARANSDRVLSDSGVLVSCDKKGVAEELCGTTDGGAVTEDTKVLDGDAPQLISKKRILSNLVSNKLFLIVLLFVFLVALAGVVLLTQFSL